MEMIEKDFLIVIIICMYNTYYGDNHTCDHVCFVIYIGKEDLLL